MKAVLMSIKPKWCEKIFNGEKTIEVRKTAPKEVPFKVYIYETKAGFIEAVRGTCPKCAFSRGKVIGSFVCDKVDKFGCKCIPRHGIAFGYEHFTNDGVYLIDRKDTDYVVFERQDRYIDTMLKNADLAAMCLTSQELFEYAGGFRESLRGWHITEPKLYDTPKELEVFWSVRCTNKKGDCEKCEVKPACINNITRPPQSWCYVEEIEE